MDVTYEPLFVAKNTPTKIRVLYVDHENNDAEMIAEMFTCLSCEVNIVKSASVASSMLSKGKSQFDLLMANLHSPDTYGSQLLQVAAKMDIPVIFLINEDNPLMAMRALEQGAILCVQKPITIELLKYLWQLVLREKILRNKKNEKFNGSTKLYELHNSHIGQVQNDDVRPKRIYITNQNVSNNEGGNMQDYVVVKTGKNGWIKWTPELHERFLTAVRILGDGGCYPKDIQELMNVPGLTRMQVASHLQKCRYGNRQSNCVKKYSFGSCPEDTSGHLFDIPPAKPRRFGTMPHLNNISPFTFGTQEQWDNQFESLPSFNNIHEHSYQVPIHQQEFNDYNSFGHVEIMNVDNTGHVEFSLDDMLTCDPQIGTNIHEHSYQVPIHQQGFNDYNPFGHVEIGNIDNTGHVEFSLDDMLTCDPQTGTNIHEQGYQVPINQQEFNEHNPFGHVEIENIDNTGHFEFSLDEFFLDDMLTCDPQISADIHEQSYNVPLNQQEFNDYNPPGHVELGSIDNTGHAEVSLDDMLTCNPQSSTNMTSCPNQGMGNTGQLQRTATDDHNKQVPFMPETYMNMWSHEALNHG